MSQWVAAILIVNTVTATTLILETIGPLATRWAINKAGEGEVIANESVVDKLISRFTNRKSDDNKTKPGLINIGPLNDT